jgi:hypothetical protein
VVVTFLLFPSGTILVFFLDLATWPASIGGVDVTVKKIPTTIQIISLKNMKFYSESNWFKLNHKIQFEFTDLKISFQI